MDQEAVIDQLANDQIHEEPSSSTESKGQPHGEAVRQLRQALELQRQESRQKELELAEAKAQLSMLNQGYHKKVDPEPQETDYMQEINSLDDDLPSGAQVKKVVSGMLGQIKRLQSDLETSKKAQGNSTLTAIERAKLKYDDYYRVVNKEHVEKYIDSPVLRKLIDSKPREEQPELAYQVIKEAMDREAKYEKNQQTQAIIQNAATKPMSTNQGAKTVGNGANSHRPMSSIERADFKSKTLEEIKAFVRAANVKK